MNENLRRGIRLLLLSGLIGLPAALAYGSSLHQGLSFGLLIEARQSLLAYVQANEIISFLVYFLIYAAAVALALPGAALLTLLGGFLFGPLWGGSLTLFAATFGACIIFILARGILRDFFAAKGEGLARKLQTEFTENGFNYLLFLRLVPIFPFFLVNIIPAFTKLPLKTYALATLIGILPGTFAFSFIGAGLDSLLANSGPEGLRLSGLLQPEFLWAISLLGLAALIPIFWKKKTKP